MAGCVQSLSPWSPLHSWLCAVLEPVEHALLENVITQSSRQINVSTFHMGFEFLHV